MQQRHHQLVLWPLDYVLALDGSVLHFALDLGLALDFVRIFVLDLFLHFVLDFVLDYVLEFVLDFALDFVPGFSPALVFYFLLEFGLDLVLGFVPDVFLDILLDSVPGDRRRRGCRAVYPALPPVLGKPSPRRDALHRCKNRCPILSRRTLPKSLQVRTPA